MSTNSADIGLLVSKALGVAIILGSFTVKLPLIRNCISMGSTKGLAAGSLYSEIIALSTSVIYNMLRGIPIGTWGELLSVLVQNYVLVFCIWYYSKYSVVTCTQLAASYVCFAYGVIFHLPQDIYFTLPFVAMAIGWSGTIPQIFANYRNQHTGPLSIITQGLIVSGSFARVFTTTQEVNDRVILFSVCCSSFLQSIILIQIVTLREKTAKFVTHETKKTE
uniref:Mannose-P-dolichol utilization defect 1 protein homolog n=1 Tax=Aplanochytrium stocchinoi TaxID=215587 RepID=A0A7S3PFS9_9STRA|mmetsp:Transcript_5603/g.6450  ORF Transcript_5603/g.6450 Transcript_5603/m.6450 type:complete len:221 (-) Transcript_5603:453-1115(-)